MRPNKDFRGGFPLILLGAFAAASVGCGQLSIRTWVNIIGEESEGYIRLVSLPHVPPLPITRLQGGFLTLVQLDTRDLPGTMDGTIALEDVRVAGLEAALTGTICTWNDPTGDSSGTISIDVLDGTSESDLFLDAKSQTWLSAALGFPPIDFENPADLDLGAMGIDTLMDALDTGSLDGAFAGQTSISAEAELTPDLPIEVALNISVNNGPKPPLFDDDLLAFCGQFFDEQGTALYHGVNSKSSYLLADEGDEPVDPLVIALAELGTGAGDTLRLTQVGTYSDETLLRDGNETQVTGVFSASDTVLGPGESVRVPDAIDAGEDIETDPYWDCFLIFCRPIPTDIPEDFRIDPQVDVVVPDGAAYLIVAPLDPDMEWEDNTGLGFGIDIEVNPGA